MSILTGCLDAELNDVALQDCIDGSPEAFGQIQKAIFWHLYTSAGARQVFEPNKAISPTDPALIANWTTYLAATDETKPVQTPFVAEPVSEAGAERVYGGGNVLPNGVSIVLGREPQPFESKLLNTPSLVIKAIKTFEKGANIRSTLGVILVNESGQLLFDSNGLSVTDVALELYAIPVHKLFVGDKTLGGLEAPDSNVLNWQFKPNWSDNLVVVTPTDFDGLEDLKNT